MLFIWAGLGVELIMPSPGEQYTKIMRLIQAPKYNNNAMQYTNDMNVGDGNGPTDTTSAIFYDEIMTKEIV